MNNLNNLIAEIEEKLLENEEFHIAIQEYNNIIFMGQEYDSLFVFGEIYYGSITNPQKLEVTDKENLCQDLYNELNNKFSKLIKSGYTHSITGEWSYIMNIGENGCLYFPDGLEFQSWTYQQITKDREKQNNNQKNKIYSLVKKEENFNK